MILLHAVFPLDPDKRDEALEEAVAYDGPALVEILTDADPV